MIGVPIAPRPLDVLVARHGGELRNGARGIVRRIVPVVRAAAGDLAPLLDVRYADDAVRAASRGAQLLVDTRIDRADVGALAGWFHPFAAWALAELLDHADAPSDEPQIGEGCRIHPSAILMPRVRIGARVTIGPGAVIGAGGFGFASGPGGEVRAIPHVGGVVVEDDVHIGALCSIASGTIDPTVIGRGVKIDAQVHIGHNCEIGEGTVIAAQTGIAGSVVVGKGVLIGGQVGIADHLRVGDGARIAAKSGVIGDVPPGLTVAGYPAVERARWLRGLAAMYRLIGGGGDERPRAPPTTTPSATPPSGAASAESSRAPGSAAPARAAPVHTKVVNRRTNPPPRSSGEGSR